MYLSTILGYCLSLSCLYLSKTPRLSAPGRFQLALQMVDFLCRALVLGLEATVGPVRAFGVHGVFKVFKVC